MIRKFQKEDTGQVMRIWLNGNKDAHPFIPKEYWEANYSMVEEQILQAEVFVYEADGEIQGFIGIVGGYIAGIFVDRAYRSLGAGRELLNCAKQLYDSLSLGVYQKNEGRFPSISGRLCPYSQNSLMKMREKQSIP